MIFYKIVATSGKVKQCESCREPVPGRLSVQNSSGGDLPSPLLLRLFSINVPRRIDLRIMIMLKASQGKVLLNTEVNNDMKLTNGFQLVHTRCRNFITRAPRCPCAYWFIPYLPKDP